MKRTLLDEAQLQAAAAELAGWEIGSERLSRTFEFGNFVRAFAFMTAAALEAEKLDHHPNWSNVYGTVEVALSTHDRGGVTEFDVELARRMTAIADGLLG